MKKALLGCLLLLTACVHDSQYKTIEPYYVLHDNSSKVWLIDHVYSGGKDHSPLSLNYKKLFVFHNSGYCYVHEIKNLGEKRGKRGMFYLDIDKHRLEILFKNETWAFTINSFSENKIVLSPADDSPFRYKLELIAFPEY
ncbi:MAG: hypothetical protein K0R65_1455 [Crocinitomicaceae bacterium]|jgi:hypothetical protein|nr:hypothetical protein [Crocinitomicaceae bacterium]